MAPTKIPVTPTPDISKQALPVRIETRTPPGVPHIVKGVPVPVSLQKRPTP
jgi:hypothetical protein